MKVAGPDDLFTEDHPFPCLLYIVTNTSPSTVLNTILSCTLHCTLKCTLYLKLYSTQKPSSLAELAQLLRNIFLCSLSSLSMYCTLYCTLYCIQYLNRYWTLYCTQYCTSCCKKNLKWFASYLRNITLLYNILNTNIYKVFNTLLCTVLYDIQYIIQKTSKCLVELVNFLRNSFLTACMRYWTP